jgi:hypothetical protein
MYVCNRRQLASRQARHQLASDLIPFKANCNNADPGQEAPLVERLRHGGLKMRAGLHGGGVRRRGLPMRLGLPQCRSSARKNMGPMEGNMHHV